MGGLFHIRVHPFDGEVSRLVPDEPVQAALFEDEQLVG